MSTDLAVRAWTILQELEARGGLHAALLDGSLQETLAHAARENSQRAARRQLVRIGVNKYPVAGDEGHDARRRGRDTNRKNKAVG